MIETPLPGLIASFLQDHGYWLLALGCLLEGETVLLLAGFAAHRGHLNFAAVLAVAASAGFIGDEMAFWLGRRHGARLVARWPRLQRQTERVDGLMLRWGAWLIVGLRFAYGLRLAGPVLIGMSGFSAWRFAAFNALGAVIWASLVAAAGWVFGQAAEALLGRIQRFEGALLAALALLALLIWWWRRAARP